MCDIALIPKGAGAATETVKGCPWMGAELELNCARHAVVRARCPKSCGVCTYLDHTAAYNGGIVIRVPIRFRVCVCERVCLEA